MTAGAITCVMCWVWLIWLFGIRPRRRRLKAERRQARHDAMRPVPVVVIEKTAGRTTIRIPGSQLPDGYDLSALSRDGLTDTACALAELDHFDPAEWDHKDTPAPLPRRPGG